MQPLIVRGDAARLALPDESVDLIVTSPPYFNLRIYKDGDVPLPGQIGSERTPDEYLEALWVCSREWWRVLKPTGSLFVNLGDRYAHGGEGSFGQAGRGRGARRKSLMLLPHRYAIGMTDGEGDPRGIGWVTRAEIVWAKTNGLPESVTDRVVRAHEQVFHFTKAPTYYANVDPLRQASADRKSGKNALKAQDDGPAGGPSGQRCRNSSDQPGATGARKNGTNPLGAGPRSWWSIANEPMPLDEIKRAIGVEHPAAYPSELPRRCILGWCPAGGVVLDPFGGSGTTAITAAALGAVGVSVELSGDYCRVAQWRHADGRLVASVRTRTNGGDRKAVDDRQLALFEVPTV